MKATSEELKEKQYEKFIASKFQIQEKTTISNASAVFKVSRPMSSVAESGLVDPLAMTEDARQWLRSTESSDKADNAFWSKRAPTTSSKLWTNPEIKDEAFAADTPIVDHRQSAPKRNTVETHNNRERPDEKFWSSD